MNISMEDIGHFIQYVGAPLSLVFLILFGLYRLGHRVIDVVEKKLFDDKFGWIPKWFSRNEQFQRELVDELKTHNAEQLLKCDRHGHAINHVVHGSYLQGEGISALLAVALAILRSQKIIADADKQRLEETLLAAKSRLDSRNRRDESND